MTNTGKAVAALLGLAVILGGIKIGLSLSNKPSDEKLIHQALNDALEASRKGKPGGVMDFLSNQLKFNDQSIGDQSQIAKVIKESHPEITVADEKVLVTGDEARIVSPVDLKANIFGQSLDQHIDNVTLVFHKEEGRDYFFIPTPKWRLSEVRLPENQVPNVSG
jgi:hypothetical protein